MNGSRGSKFRVSASAILAPFCIVAFGVSASSLAPSIAVASACLERIPCAVPICFAGTAGLFRVLSPCSCALRAIPQRLSFQEPKNQCFLLGSALNSVYQVFLLNRAHRATVQSSCQTDMKCVSLLPTIIESAGQFRRGPSDMSCA